MQVLSDGADGGTASIGAGRADDGSQVAGSCSGLGAVLLLSSGDNATTSNNISQANSAVSIDCAEQQVASTIGKPQKKNLLRDINIFSLFRPQG